ncbi:hypothetical protein L7F22_043313, partial [Adiantum nelumboides]|nr:hypothetical protein [Adiantum nelumboides]
EPKAPQEFEVKMEAQGQKEVHKEVPMKELKVEAESPSPPSRIEEVFEVHRNHNLLTPELMNVEQAPHKEAQNTRDLKEEELYKRKEELEIPKQPQQESKSALP